MAAHPDLATMDPEVIAKLVFGELGNDSPWQDLLAKAQTTVLTGQEQMSAKFFGAAGIDAGVSKAALQWSQIQNLTEKLIADGVDPGNAANIASRILTEDTNTINLVLDSLNLSDKQVAEISAIRFEAGGPS